LLTDRACWDQFKVKQLAVNEEQRSTYTAKLKLKKQEQSFNRVSKVKTIQVKHLMQTVAS
jgi:bifunctional DNase/RNase